MVYETEKYFHGILVGHYVIVPLLLQALVAGTRMQVNNKASPWLLHLCDNCINFLEICFCVIRHNSHPHLF